MNFMLKTCPYFKGPIASFTILLFCTIIILYYPLLFHKGSIKHKKHETYTLK